MISVWSLHHCKSTAFDVIEARCSKLAIDPYVTPEEVLSDLNNMYGEFDVYVNADARLHDPDFVMTTQPFDEFLATFTATIAPLKLREQQGISHLPRIISPRLRWQTMNGIKQTSFQAYFQQLRQCDLNRRLADREQQRLGTRYVS